MFHCNTQHNEKHNAAPSRHNDSGLVSEVAEELHLLREKLLLALHGGAHDAVLPKNLAKRRAWMHHTDDDLLHGKFCELPHAVHLLNSWDGQLPQPHCFLGCQILAVQQAIHHTQNCP